ncbi:hypothetical protein ACR720_04590 [Sphingomonas parapaucimobilis]|uniref:hypothetical protein n=1 Tax=Sphingomonas parapaucimobilis TaxID=28213 RepID=UPI003EED3B04
MKFASLLAAGLAVATLGLSASADAQRWRHDDPRGHHAAPGRHGPPHRGPARYNRHDGPRWHGRNHYRQQRCQVEYSHRAHKRIRVCR